MAKWDLERGLLSKTKEAVVIAGLAVIAYFVFLAGLGYAVGGVVC